MLYLTDLDFTLLRSDATLSAYTQQVWNEAVDAGVRLSVATARSLTGVRELLAPLRLHHPLILLDGTLIVAPDGTILDLSVLERPLTEAILAAADAMGHRPLIVALDAEGNERFYYPPAPNACQQRLIATMHNRRRILGGEAYRAPSRTLKMVFMDEEAPMRALEAALKERWGDVLETKRAHDGYLDCWFLTLLHPHGDKAHALARLEQLADAPPSETTVFGDSHNDLGMFEVAGYSVAVANAIDALKARADRVLEHTNDEDAVARFLYEEAIMRN
jgi:Cof subfamily protein (haloacid dehalogenase superfamily)